MVTERGKRVAAFGVALRKPKLDAEGFAEDRRGA
jgi:hypothetical protein